MLSERNWIICLSKWWIIDWCVMYWAFQGNPPVSVLIYSSLLSFLISVRVDTLPQVLPKRKPFTGTETNDWHIPVIPPFTASAGLCLWLLYLICNPVSVLLCFWCVAGPDVFLISVDERAKYDQQFHSLAPTAGGYITGNSTQQWYTPAFYLKSHPGSSLCCFRFHSKQHGFHVFYMRPPVDLMNCASRQQTVFHPVSVPS